MKGKGKKAEKLGASKYVDKEVTKERFQEIVDQLEKGAELAGWKEEGTMKEDTDKTTQREPDVDFSWKAPWDSRKSWKAVEDILRNAETLRDLRGVRTGNRKIKKARKAAGAMIAVAGWVLEMGATADGNGEETWEDLIQEAEAEKNLAGMKAVYQAKVWNGRRMRQESSEPLSG